MDYLQKSIQLFQTSIDKMNKSHLIGGLFIIFLNIGSKYVELGLTKTQEQALRNTLTREMLIFATVFVATHDLLLSILITGAFAAMTNHIFNEKSPYCPSMIKQTLQKYAYELDTNKDGIISPEEEKRALEILRNAELQKEKYIQASFASLLPSYPQ
jgi:hypothetical protein